MADRLQTRIGVPAFDDLTARARIRDAALKHFAEDGFAGATIRKIAQTARVSPGLVRHHFGSKEALRRACDDYIVEALHRFNEQALVGFQLGDPGFGSSRNALRPFQRYVARALVDGSSAAAMLFDEMAKITEQWLARADESDPDPPATDRRTRAALITAMATGIPLMHEHVSRVIGVDMFAPEGDRQVALALLDIYSHSLINVNLAAAAQADLTKAQHESP